MAGTEIDDIFRGKTPKVRNVQKGKEGEKESRAEKGKVGEGSATAQKGKEKRKKKASAHTNQEEPVQKKNANPESKKKAETIVDPSQSIGKKSEKPNKQAKKTKLSEEDEQFRDSRGSKRTRTEEGYSVYSEAELGLNNAGGGTPLCPFDCNCCF